MAKVWKQNIPSADLHFYTRGLTQLKETGFNYWNKIYGYGYGGIISTRIPFRMYRWQDKHAVYMPPKRRKARDVFKAAAYDWKGTPYEYGAKAQDLGVKNKLYWWGIAEKGGFQYYQLFMYYTLSVLHRDEIPHWLRIYKFEHIGFGDWYFGEELPMIAKCKAYLNIPQPNIPHATGTKVLLDAVSFDVGGNFDLVNHRFIAPADGYYQVNGAVRYGSVTVDKRYYVMLSKNGSSQAQSIGHSAETGNVAPSVSDIIYLEKNQYVELFVYHTGGVDAVDLVEADQNTFLSVAGTL